MYYLGTTRKSQAQPLRPLGKPIRFQTIVTRSAMTDMKAQCRMAASSMLALWQLDNTRSSPLVVDRALAADLRAPSYRGAHPTRAVQDSFDCCSKRRCAVRLETVSNGP